MTPTEIAAILARHAEWLDDLRDGKNPGMDDPRRATLTGANLTRADLTDANLAGANLAGATLTDAYLTDADLAGATLTDANLTRADLTRATLTGANLAGANLTRADLAGATLTGATLTRADLTRANLAGATLTGANLTRADLTRADLTDANLTRADLAGADLAGANLAGANLARAILPQFQIVPESGSFRGWKKLQDGLIAEVEIPADAERVSSTGRKCRAQFVLVLALYKDGVRYDGVGMGKHDGGVEYRAGLITRPDSWDSDIRTECSHGIHFFLRRAEAEAY